MLFKYTLYSTHSGLSRRSFSVIREQASELPVEENIIMLHRNFYKSCDQVEVSLSRQVTWLKQGTFLKGHLEQGPREWDFSLYTFPKYLLVTWIKTAMEYVNLLTKFQKKDVFSYVFFAANMKIILKMSPSFKFIFQSGLLLCEHLKTYPAVKCLRWILSRELFSCIKQPLAEWGCKC